MKHEANEAISYKAIHERDIREFIRKSFITFGASYAGEKNR